jgi:hypothetical protein
VDFKGLNVKDFGRIVREEASGYEIQLADYMMLYNSQLHRSSRIEKALLLAENKGGPDNNHLIALHETMVELSDWKRLVRHRLGVLREYEAEKEIPPPECTTVNGFQFQSCPFRKYCKTEIQKIQAEQKRSESSNGQYQIATPKTRSRKSRRR